MVKTNSAAIANLPSASKAYVEAFLLEYSTDPKIEKRVWTFQYNPSVLKFSGDAKYSSSDTFATRVPDQQFGGSSGLTLEISGIYLDTYCLNKSLKPLLDGLDELRKADLKNSKFNPTILSFVFGSRRFSPCVLTRLSWDEGAWLGGEPARVQLNMTLLQVPPPGQLGIKAIAPEPDANQKQQEGKPRKDLTDRQKEEASKKAKEWLIANQQKLDPIVANAIKTNGYKLVADAKSGDVAMLDVKGKKLGTVGRWDGKTFTTDKINTLPKKK